MKLTIEKIIFCLIVFSSLQSFAIKPNRVYRFYPEKLSLIYRDLDVTTSDGLKIKTWFFPAQHTPSEQEISASWEKPIKKPYKTIDNKLRPTLIIANGDAGNMSYQQLNHAQYFTSKGYNVVTFDWRGFGESSEWEMNVDYLVYSELLIDYDAVIKEVLKQEEVDTSKMAVYGWSTGAYLSMAAANNYDNIKVFIGIGLMTSFTDVVPVLMQSQNKKKNNLIVPDDYPKEQLPILLAPNYNKSTFLIVGEKDDRTPVWMSEKIYLMLPSNKELWIVEGAEHGGQKGPLKDFEVFHKRVLEFLEIHLD